jgi:hypothetical protein
VEYCQQKRRQQCSENVAFYVGSSLCRTIRTRQFSPPSPISQAEIVPRDLPLRILCNHAEDRFRPSPPITLSQDRANIQTVRTRLLMQHSVVKGRKRTTQCRPLRLSNSFALFGALHLERGSVKQGTQRLGNLPSLPNEI